MRTDHHDRSPAPPTGTDISASSKRWGLGRWARALGTAVVVIMALGCWRIAAPTKLGGNASYAVVSGTSMLPGIRTGDLVITTRHPTYAVGDVVAYHNRVLGEMVVHRIVAVSGDRFVLRGDNNGFDDAYRPTASDIVGARWRVLGGGGNYLHRLHNPVFAGVLGAGVALLAFAGTELPAGRRRRSGGEPADTLVATGQA